MNVALFLRGLVLGFSIAAPIGPISMLCIQRTLTRGRAVGFVSGLGAATADAIYGSIAAFGVVSVSDFLGSYGTTLRILGGAVLSLLGVRALLARPSQARDASSNRGLLWSWASTSLLTLTNPFTIMSFAAVFAGLGLATESADAASAASLIAGVFLGSASWWLALSLGVGALRRRLTPRALRWTSAVAGTAIVALGVWVFASAL